MIIYNFFGSGYAGLGINKMIYNNFHKVFYDFDTLKGLLTEVGFVKVTRSSLKGSAHQEFNDCATDTKIQDAQSLYVEAVK